MVQSTTEGSLRQLLSLQNVFSLRQVVLVLSLELLVVQFLIVHAVAHSFFEFALVYQLASFEHVFHPVEPHYDGCLREF